MSESSSDNEVRRIYFEALMKFNADLKSFEDEIPRVTQMSLSERANFVLKNYEGHLRNMFERPRTKEGMGIVTCAKIDELKIFTSAINVGWKLWPDYWTGLIMMIDYLAGYTLPEDIARLDIETMRTVKQIALWTAWFNDPISNPDLVSQAKIIIARKKSGEPGDFGAKRARFAFTLVRSKRYKPKVDLSQVCHGVDCFDIETETVKFKRCSQCRRAVYCSKDCQAKSWKTHKKVCSTPF